MSQNKEAYQFWSRGVNMENVMTINKIKKIIQNDYGRRQEILKTKKYYNNDNDITRKYRPIKKCR